MTEETRERLLKRIMVLNGRIWENRVPMPRVDQWLENFTGRVTDVENERLHALFWLSQFMYFGSREIRVLLRSLYRDLYLCPMIQEIKASLTDTADLQLAVNDELEKTRFFGVGNPSESGAHLLYYFRQENNLPKTAFMDAVRIFSGPRDPSSSTSRPLRDPSIRRYVFIDDVCGSGETAKDYSDAILTEIKSLNPKARVCYFSMFASMKGLEVVRTETLFGQDCGAVYELDSSYRCLSNESRYLKNTPYAGIDPMLARRIAMEYGSLLNLSCASGYKDSQMLMGFHHNTPDNTLVIMWHDHVVHGGDAWMPIFKRYPKVLGEVA